MARTLRNLRISEVSGVDKGAGHGTRIMVRKALDYDVIDAIAKRRSAAVLLDTALGETRKAHPGLSESAVFDKALRDNPRAREWWHVVKGTPDPAHTVAPNIVTKAAAEREPDEPDDDADERHAAGKAFNSIVDHLQRVHAGTITRSQAIDRALNTPEGRQAFDRYHRAA